MQISKKLKAALKIAAFVFITPHNTHFAASLPSVATPILLRGEALRAIFYRATTSQSAERIVRHGGTDE